MDHCNTNGLVDGNIPARDPCPFLSECRFKVDGCPGSTHGLKDGPFSCGAARLLSMVRGSDQETPEKKN